MAKLKNPLLSLSASGRLGRVLTFLKRSGQHLVEKTPLPEDAKSLAQLSWRTMYQKAVVLWHALSAAEKELWESQARSRHMTGFAWFMSQALRPNPGLYLPLTGGTMTGDILMGANRVKGLPNPTFVAEATRKSYVDALEARYQIGARVYHSANQAIPNTTLTALSFDSEDFDTDGIHDPITNNSRLTCKTAGKYLVYALVWWTANAVGSRELRIRENGVTDWANTTKPSPANDTDADLTTVIDLSVGDYLEVIVWQNSGGALTIDGGGFTQQLHFGMQRIG